MTITFNHAAQAASLSARERSQFGMPVIKALRSVPSPDWMPRDSAGIPDRPSTLLAEAIEAIRPTALAVACARHMLVYQGACRNAIYATESSVVFSD